MLCYDIVLVLARDSGNISKQIAIRPNRKLGLYQLMAKKLG